MSAKYGKTNHHKKGGNYPMVSKQYENTPIWVSNTEN